MGSFQSFQEKVRGTNINEQTLLATDYLNHFNEIIMTLEMVPDMPDIMEEALAWQPKSYQEHFSDSSFADKDLAIAAYEHAPERFRGPFEQAIGQATRLVARTVTRMQNQIATGNGDALRQTAMSSIELLRKLTDMASANIHGSETVMDQSEIDIMIDEEEPLAPEPQEKTKLDSNDAQAAIDALFD